jgi:hypothetical protein
LDTDDFDAIPEEDIDDDGHIVFPGIWSYIPSTPSVKDRAWHYANNVRCLKKNKKGALRDLCGALDGALLSAIHK